MQLTRESNRARIVHCIRPHTLFLLAVLRSSQPSSVHQRVSVGHYLLHPNNREFTQRTRTTLANHRPRALLLTPDLSTHTMFSSYISAESSASPPFRIYSKTTRKQKVRLGANPSHEFSQYYSQRQLACNSSRQHLCQAAEGAQTQAGTRWRCAFDSVCFY